MTSIQLGRFIRSIRQEKGLSIEEVADSYLSIPMVEKIENGEEGFSKDKLLHLLDNLGLSWNGVQDRMRREMKEREEIVHTLSYTEYIMDSSNNDLTPAPISSIEIQRGHPYYPMFEYITGRIHLTGKPSNKKQAKKHLLQAIELTKENPHYDYLNVMAAAYYFLGRIACQEENLTEALAMYRQGSQALIEKGERSYLRYPLLLHQAEILIQLDRFEEAERIQYQLLQDWNRIETIQTQLGFHINQSRIFYYREQYLQAMEQAKKGLHLAQINHFHKESIELWRIWGESALSLSNHQEHQSWIRILQNTYLPSSDQPEVEIHTLLLRCQIHINSQEIQKAEDDIQRAIQLAKKMNESLHCIEALVLQADIHNLRKATKQAETILREAEKIAQNHQFATQLKRIHHRLTHREPVL